MATSASVVNIANVIIPAADPERLLQFYTGELGLEKRADASFGAGQRWIEVAPRGAQTVIVICPPGPGVKAGGKDTGMPLHTNDVDGFHAQMKSRGVDVDPDVSRFGDTVPPLFWFRDPEGNRLIVVQGSASQT